MRPEVIDFLAKADQSFEFTQREKITLGLLAQHEALTARDLVESLKLASPEELGSWLGRLQRWNVIAQTGRTKGTRYFIQPELFDKMDFSCTTTLTRIEPHRLRALILEDLDRHPRSAFGEIHQRIGAEIPSSQVRRAISALLDERRLTYKGEKRWRRYWTIGGVSHT